MKKKYFTVYTHGNMNYELSIKYFIAFYCFFAVYMQANTFFALTMQFRPLCAV